MARFVASLLYFGFIVFAAGAAIAQSTVPDRRVVLTQDVDFVGSDIANIFDTTLRACEAACLINPECQGFTFNQRSNACFPKRLISGSSEYVGAVSARVFVTNPQFLAQSDARTAELSFLGARDFSAALSLASEIGRDRPENQSALQEVGRRVAVTDLATDWLRYGTLARTLSNNNMGSRAMPAFVSAYVRALNDAERVVILQEMAIALEDSNRGRTMIPALRLAYSILPNREVEAQLEAAIAKHGFRVTDTQVESDSAAPRICAVFNEELVKAGVDYAPFVQLSDPTLVVQINDGQLCIDGVNHGERYRIVLREGLPAASGETLTRPTELNLYVRDRTPAVRFTSRAYVLPRLGDIAIPLETVNLPEVDLELRRMTDRNLIRSMQTGLFNSPLYPYDEERLADQFASTVWEGTAQTQSQLNRDVLTRVPLDEVLTDAEAGIYILTASVPGADPYDNPPATQWFVLSDLGIATYLGVDGLTVAVRGLGDAAAKEGAIVTLLSEGNAVLGTTTTDADGTAQFAAGLTRGLGVNAPALVTVSDSDDAAFLSLRDAAFDLSDRGVEGREPSPPIDVFMTTDRGAYRAGEVIHVTALMRDAQAGSVGNVPLTAVLTRPDGVEYSRTTSTTALAGGHVFALPTAGSAPRGTWKIALTVEGDAAPLASSAVLVEDFLPERVDFDLSLPSDLRQGDSPLLSIDARYLFGPPAGDLEIEGEALLRAATTLDGYEGYRFGRYDEPLNAEVTYLNGGRTDSVGRAEVAVNMANLNAAQPLELRVTARVTEGSGRPVERQITASILPGRDMIGIKPMFDDVVTEGSTAEFQVIGLGTNLTPEPMDIQWTLNRVTTRYQWYSLYGDWRWEPITRRERVASGAAALADGPITVSADVEWGQYELVVERTGADYLASATSFYAGWYAPAAATDTPDVLQASLDATSYAIGDTATFRIVPRYAGTAVVTVMSNQLITMKTVAVTEGENLIQLPVTAEWGAGAYVSATVIRPMDVAAGRNPARALGLGYAAVDPAQKALQVSMIAPETAQPRERLEVAVQVGGVQAGETAYVTLAAVDLGILNITGFDSPDPAGHYFGQRKLGVELRDIYGRLIDGLNGAMGTVRSGGDAQAGLSQQSPPPTEELVAYFEGPVIVGADGKATVGFDLPAFNGTVRLMAVAWSDTGVGQSEADVLVRDPVVVTASVPRFLAPGDQSRMLLEIVHADGPAGQMGLNVQANGLALANVPPATITLPEGGKLVYAIPFAAFDVGVHDINISLTTPDGRSLTKSLTVPVVRNDPETSRISRFNLAAGDSFLFDSQVFAGFAAGTGSAALSVGPLARLDAPGLLSSLDRYPYGCTEQITSRAMPLLYLDGVAAAMGLGSRDQTAERISESIAEVLSNQSANGAFGLWRAGSGDMWLDAYVTDFLSRAQVAGHAVPEIAFRNAIDNLRNRVNYYPDFDSGGADLAYALFVLAREGDAAVGDLRYYADQKADAFDTIALAHLGAALAQYGDQPRADRLLGQAGRNLEIDYASAEALGWRSDYGTRRRDAAAVLALAVEAGSQAIDRETITLALAQTNGPASTQEASWTLLAANALISDLSSEGITVNGQTPAGPIAYVLEDEAGATPLTFANTGPRSTEVTLTTFGVAEIPEPAGGNGYAITRAYFDTDGNPVSNPSVAAGSRLVTVLTVTPFGRQDARLMVNDPLPAGFEIDNPNLLQGGDIRALEWLEPIRGENAEFRSDRFLAAVDWRSDKPFQLAYIVRAVSPGSFHHPAASVVDMYRPQMRANTDAGRVIITE